MSRTNRHMSMFSLTSYFRNVVEMVLNTGFDINVRTARGTALHEAALCGKVKNPRGEIWQNRTC